MAASNIMIPQTHIVEPDDGFTLRLARKPEVVIAEATLCANALMAAVRKNGWAQKFGNNPKEHLYFEAWSFLATMYRVTPRVRETRLVQIGDVTGYEAYAEAFHVPSSIVISTGDSMCLDDEENWDSRPEYEWKGSGDGRKKVKVGERPVPLFQLRSMSQTRAMSRALRGPFSWIVAMAGFAPTTAEDMSSAGQQQRVNEGADPQQQQGGNKSDAFITEPMQKRLFAIGKGLNLSNDKIAAVLKQHGFETSAKITRDKYDAVVEAIQKAGEPPQQQQNASGDPQHAGDQQQHKPEQQRF